MKNLIEKLEAAPEGSRELDAEVACAVKFTHLRPARPDDFGGQYAYVPGNLKCEHGFLQADRYTTSLDAALMLVPEGATWTLEPDAAWVRFIGRDGDVEEAQGNFFRRDGKATALALCIAALQAREASA